MVDVKQSPRKLAHSLCVQGCLGFRGGEHTEECDRLTRAFIEYGRWRVSKALGDMGNFDR